jgi:hypothetical protein
MRVSRRGGVRSGVLPAHNDDFDKKLAKARGEIT